MYWVRCTSFCSWTISMTMSSYEHAERMKPISNARKIITLFVVYIFGWFDFWFAILGKNLLFVCKFKLKNFNTQKLFCNLILINF